MTAGGSARATKGPVASAGGHQRSRPHHSAVTRPDYTELAKDMCETFRWMRDEGVPLGKAVSRLRKLYDSGVSPEEFFGYFIFLLQLPLSYGSLKERMSTFDEKVLETACKFAVSFLTEAMEKQRRSKEDGDESQDMMVEMPVFLKKLFDWLLDHHDVEGSQTRLRICLMINRLLKLLGEDAEIDDELYQKIYDNMLERLQDKVAEIRGQAVTALQRLQDPRDQNCPIVKAFIFHLGCDPSPVVRRAVVKCIGATRLTLPHIVRRTLDVDEQVRRAAYKFIADKVHIKSLTIAQREEIVRRGLTDRNDNVRRVVSKELVPAWLRSCNENVVELLYALDVGNSDGETASKVLHVVFEGVPYKELVDNFQFLDSSTRLVPIAKLTPETAVYWKELGKFLYEQFEEKRVAFAGEALESLLPELTKFVSYVRQYVLEFKKRQEAKEKGPVHDEDIDEEAMEVAFLFVANQLVEMTKLFDLADEMGRNSLLRLCRELLANRNVPIDLVENSMRVFGIVHKKPESRVQEVAEIIAEIREPLLQTTTRAAATNDNDKESGIGGEDVESAAGVGDHFSDQENPDVASRSAEAVAPTKAELERREAAQRKKQVEMAKVRVQLNILKNDLEEAIQNQDFVRAQEIKMEMDKLDIEQNRLQDELTEAAAMAPLPDAARRSLGKEKLPSSAVVHNALPVQQDGEKDLFDEDEDAGGEVVDKNMKSCADDPQVIRKSLKMLSVLLENTDIQTMSPTLQSLLDEFVVPSIRNVDYRIRNCAVQAMGSCCLRSLESAKRNLLLILQMAHLDVAEVRLTSIGVIFDLLMWHGLPAFIGTSAESRCSDSSSDIVPNADAAAAANRRGALLDDEMSNIESVLDSEMSAAFKLGRNLTQKEFESQGGNSVVAILSHLLDDPDIEIRTRVAEGLCKMMMSGAISSPKLFTRLILIWYNPMTEADGKLRHILGTFFPLYASFSRTNQDAIEESFMPTLKVLFEAPPSNPLSALTEADIDDVGAFFIQLTRADLLQNHRQKGDDNEDSEDIASDIGATVHDSMAYTLCNHILVAPDSSRVKLMIKLLLHLQITCNNYVKLRELKTLHTQMMAAVRDKMCLKSLEKFGARLDDWLARDPDVLPQQQPVIDSVVQLDEEVAQDLATTTMNATRFNRKRTLFSTEATTLLDLTSTATSPTYDPSSTVIRRSSSPTGSSSARPLPAAPIGESPNKKARNSSERDKVAPGRSASSVTRIEESFDEDDLENDGVAEKAKELEHENEEVVSGNIFRSSKHKNKTVGVVTSTQASSQGNNDGNPDKAVAAKSVSPIRRRPSRSSTVSAASSSASPSSSSSVSAASLRKRRQQKSNGSKGDDDDDIFAGSSEETPDSQEVRKARREQKRTASSQEPTTRSRRGAAALASSDNNSSADSSLGGNRNRGEPTKKSSRLSPSATPKNDQNKDKKTNGTNPNTVGGSSNSAAKTGRAVAVVAARSSPRIRAAAIQAKTTPKPSPVLLRAKEDQARLSARKRSATLDQDSDSSAYSPLTSTRMSTRSPAAVRSSERQTKSSKKNKK